MKFSSAAPTCDESVCLDKAYLLLIYHLKPFWRLPAYIVCSDNPSSVSQIAVEEGGAPSAQTSKVIALLLHVLDQLPTCKSGHSPRLIVGDTLLPVVRRMCPDVRNVVAKPGGQVCQSRERGPIDPQLQQGAPLNFKFLTKSN